MVPGGVFLQSEYVSYSSVAVVTVAVSSFVVAVAVIAVVGVAALASHGKLGPKHHWPASQASSMPM